MTTVLDQSIKNFIDTVAAMREAQKRYFKTRAQADLIEAKKLEWAVDKRVVELRSTLKTGSRV